MKEEGEENEARRIIYKIYVNKYSFGFFSVIDQSPDNVREFPSRYQVPNPGHTLRICRAGPG